MDFYDYKVEDIRKQISNFGKGAYGKTIFVLAYSPALIIAIITVIIELCGTPGNIICEYGDYLAFWILGVMLSFILGSTYYYAELRKFMEHQAKLSNKIEKATKVIGQKVKTKAKKSNKNS